MSNYKSFQQHVLNSESENFESLALKIFKYQADSNPVYQDYIRNLGLHTGDIKYLLDIPFMPISMFKYHDIKSGVWEPEVCYESSGTTSGNSSRHLVRDQQFYYKNALRLFEDYFGSVRGYNILALLPSYLERSNSSLVSMIGHFIKSASSGSGFYLNNYGELIKKIEELGRKKIILWGVAFALLSLAKYKIDLSKCIIIETGGMKGRGKEIVRKELYSILRNRFNVETIYSEYGMTELLSQSYASNGKFINSTSMRVLIRDINDPFVYVDTGKTGGVNIVDLSNIHSCSFIETMDLGRYDSESTYEILGRFDNSDIRGCNLLLNL